MDTNSSTPPPNVPDVTEPAKEEKEIEGTESPPVNRSSTKLSILAGQVKMVDLMGVKIVALIMEGQERLCLAQISSTLLSEYSYNEIHNRRVALGITCVQCTPVQLEILRRAGAMPVSSRRCGMITKREAERLCKSFLTDNAPPKLPDNFSFDVQHRCAWGCKGKFVPSRYNSSRAKCVQCVHCRMFFSPNKFIFHSHRFTDSNYTQPDAANFNSWRRHLHLCRDNQIPEHVVHAWEDVKAMFNGGHIRSTVLKRENSSPGNSVNSTHQTIPTSNHVTSDVVRKKSYCPPYTGFNSSNIHSPAYTSPMNYFQHTQQDAPSELGWLCGPRPLHYAALAAAASSSTSGCWFPYSPLPMNPLMWPSATSLFPLSAGSAFENTSSSVDLNKTTVKNVETKSDQKKGTVNTDEPATTYSHWTKEKLQELLMSEIRTRQKLENDLTKLKGKNE